MLIGILSILATNAQAGYWTNSVIYPNNYYDDNIQCPPGWICCYW